jgi:hypothetical protein
MGRLLAMVDEGVAKPVSWPNANRVLDQEDHPFCVAFGICGLLNTDDELHNDPAFDSFYAMDFFKTIPNADPLQGAYIRDGLKAAKAQGLIAAYALLRTDAEVDEWLSNHGPVLVGSAWTEDMMEPLDGTVFVNEISDEDSGHCYYWHGQDTYWRIGTNSWSETWGRKGQFWMRRCDDSRLRHAGGEAWAIVQPVPVRAAPLSWWQRLIKLFRGGT